MPTPVSLTANRTSPGTESAQRNTSPPGRVNLTALWMRLIKTCSSLCKSTSTPGRSSSYSMRRVMFAHVPPGLASAGRQSEAGRMPRPANGPARSARIQSWRAPAAHLPFALAHPLRSGSDRQIAGPQVGHPVHLPEAFRLRPSKRRAACVSSWERLLTKSLRTFSRRRMRVRS